MMVMRQQLLNLSSAFIEGCSLSKGQVTGACHLAKFHYRPGSAALSKSEAVCIPVRGPSVVCQSKVDTHEPTEITSSLGRFQCDGESNPHDFNGDRGPSAGRMRC